MPLNPMYAGENQLQAINHKATAIERETGIEVVRCHLGNPTGPQFEASNQLLAEHYKKRGTDPNSRGYADVAGDAGARLGIAKALCRINRLTDNALDEKNIIGVSGGTGALNVALAIFSNPKSSNTPTVLVADPFYPPWKNIAERVNCDFATFPLRKQDSYLLNEKILSEKIQSIIREKPNSDVILVYHYPNNPTGKTLTEAESIQIGHTLNNLCKKFPNLKLVQEDLYLATTTPELGIHTPLAHLDNNARNNAIWLHSPSKMGHQRDRAAVIAAFNPELLVHLRGATSFDILGTSTPALMATANTLMHIAQGGVDAIDAKTSRSDNHRFVTSRYYQERLKVVYEGLKDIENTTGNSLLADGLPKGAYYLYPSFELLKGKPIPEALLPAFNDKKTFDNADDVTNALANAHLLGLRPMTVASGTLFTNDPSTMSLRISTVDPNIENLRAGANTIKGLVQKTLGIELGASFLDIDKLKKQSNQRSKPPFRWDKRVEGRGREWGINP